jgi:hypothetical protein
MRRIQQYMTGSLFLMTLSAAAETWFSSKTGHGLVLSSHELLESLFPTALENIELSAKEYFPIFWGLATSTILQLPLWSIFAIATIYFSYLLMTDTSEIKRYGKDFNNLEMWSRLAHGDSALYLDRRQIHGKNVTDKSIHTDNVKPALSTLDLLLDDEAGEAEDLGTIIDNSLSDIISEDDEQLDQSRSQKELRSAYVNPEIWEPISYTDNEIVNKHGNQTADKDEIDEFDDFCEFLNYTEAQFDEEEFNKAQILEKMKNEK